MTVSSIATPSTILTALAQSSRTAIGMSTQVVVDQVTAQIDRQLRQKIAALPSEADNTLMQVTQSQAAIATKQFNKIANLSKQFGVNGNVLTSINKELDAMQTAAANGDGANFDKAYSVIVTDIGNLVLVPPTAPFQPDQILPLKSNGLAIKDAASYDLSTQAGQDAAKADINTAQQQINQILAITTNNQLVAGSLATAISSQIGTLNRTLQQTKTNSDTHLATETARLTQLAQNQEHLIQLALGSTTQLADALAKMATVADAPSSPFGVLTNAVGATAATITPQQVSSAVLSLLA